MFSAVAVLGGAKKLDAGFGLVATETTLRSELRVVGTIKLANFLILLPVAHEKTKQFGPLANSKTTNWSGLSEFSSTASYHCPA